MRNMYTIFIFNKGNTLVIFVRFKHSLYFLELQYLKYYYYPNLNLPLAYVEIDSRLSAQQSLHLQELLVSAEVLLSRPP